MSFLFIVRNSQHRRDHILSSNNFFFLSSLRAIFFFFIIIIMNVGKGSGQMLVDFNSLLMDGIWQEKRYQCLWLIDDRGRGRGWAKRFHIVGYEMTAIK